MSRAGNGKESSSQENTPEIVGMSGMTGVMEMAGVVEMAGLSEKSGVPTPVTLSSENPV